MKHDVINKMSGVYCITNLLTDEIYIGSSSNLYKRLSCHKNYQNLKMFGNQKIKTAYDTHGIENFKFEVMKYTNDFREWEAIFIKLLAPDYNSVIPRTYTVVRPNLGKKLSKEWKDKITNSLNHSEEVKDNLTKINKEGATKVKVFVEDYYMLFESVISAETFFKSKLNRKTNTISGFSYEILKTQKKKVLLLKDEKEYMFDSSYECDRFLNLWRGCTSNTIKNNSGRYADCIISYI